MGGSKTGGGMVGDCVAVNGGMNSRPWEFASSDSQAWEWSEEESHTVGDPAKFRRGCELRNFL